MVGTVELLELPELPEVWVIIVDPTNSIIVIDDVDLLVPSADWFKNHSLLIELPLTFTVYVILSVEFTLSIYDTQYGIASRLVPSTIQKLFNNNVSFLYNEPTAVPDMVPLANTKDMFIKNLEFGAFGVIVRVNPVSVLTTPFPFLTTLSCTL